MKEQELVCSKPACFAACLQLKLISRCCVDTHLMHVHSLNAVRLSWLWITQTNHGYTSGHPNTHVVSWIHSIAWEITKDLNTIITPWIKHVTGSMWSICNTFIRYTTTLHHKALRFTRPLHEQTRSAAASARTVQNVPFTLLSGASPNQTQVPKPAPLEALNRALCELNLRPYDVAVVFPTAALIIPIISLMYYQTTLLVCLFLNAVGEDNPKRLVVQVLCNTFLSPLIQFSLQAKQVKYN